ncbi:hypothetical protein DFJ58DRAFT_735125 [Suillus subalutaceus]|uniref:uncharacterized protein n=1 Tax=Suillus subalutaceus TaxID=48586 RepID=UPI001B870295|nr:uncharacterized protein DFJ58DRAFT_735125 [Suillus subalutaceus]KAG1836198.1 hypothetical protein DFJ58DRAFT_735125 [Suillus subalutaceus]
MTRQYRRSNCLWMALFIDDPRCPIPAEWVHELSCSFVGDLSTKVPRTGIFISSVHCPWELQLPMFKHFSIPIWVHCQPNFHMNLCHYNPSQEVVACAIEAQCQSNSTWGQDDGAWVQDDGAWVQDDGAWVQDNGAWGQDDGAWGQDDGVWGKQDGETQTQSALRWDDNATQTALGWGPAPEAPQVDSHFPVPQKLSGKNQEKTGRPSLHSALRKIRRSRRRNPQLNVNHARVGNRQRRDIIFLESPVRSQYSNGNLKTSLGAFATHLPHEGRGTDDLGELQNEWDLCDQLDPTSTPDGNWEEDNFNFSDPIPDPLPPPPPAPPSLFSFLQDIHNYFGRHEVAPSSNYTEGVEHFVTHLQFHLSFHLAASTTRSIGGSATFENWVKKQKFSHVGNIVGDSGEDVDSISDVQKHVITYFIGYLATLPTSQLSEILSDHWDLAPGTPLSALNAFI